MTTNLDKQTLMVMLNSNKLSDYQKIKLARHYNQTTHRAEQAEMVKDAFKAAHAFIANAFNLRGLIEYIPQGLRTTR